jgi:hypothetical protein
MTSSLIINISCLIIQERKVFKFEDRNDICFTIVFIMLSSVEHILVASRSS